MTERRVARKNVTKQMVYAGMAARAVGQVKEKEEGDGVVATSKYCIKVIEDDEDGEDENEDEDEEENGLETEAQGNGDDLDAFKALSKSLSSSPTQPRSALSQVAAHVALSSRSYPARSPASKQPAKQKLSPLLYVARHGEPRHGGPNLRQRTQFCIFFTMCSPPALASASPTLHWARIRQCIHKGAW